jgi:acyl-CoA synthetase (AMP-forming)/AMP-acid ligase II/acyl carrier protein
MLYESLVEVLQSYARSHPNDVPFTFLADGEKDEQHLSYASFDEKARKIGASLQQNGLEGERVLLLFPQSLEYLIALFGCFYAGVVAVPAYPPRNNRNLQRLLAIMENCDAGHILTDQQGMTHMLQMEQQYFTPYRFLLYTDLIASNREWKERAVSKEDIAYLQYTSGSTGSPKGVIITHQNMMMNVRQCERSYSADMRRAFNWIPMYHDMGLISMMCYLARNAHCYFMSPAHFLQKPIRWLSAISRYKIQFTLGPNFAFDLCCDKIEDSQLEQLDLSSLKDVITGSERVRLSTMTRFYNKFKKCGFHIDAFVPSYGLAEATLIVSTTGPAQAPVATPDYALKETKVLRDSDLQDLRPEDYHISNGPAVEDAVLKIVEPASGSVLQDGRIGEIWVHSPQSVSRGYWNDRSESERTFNNYLPSDQDKRFLKTGDLGFLKDGELYVTGRIKDMIIIRGTNYYPEDIEYVAQESHSALEPNAGAAFSIEEDEQEKLIIVQEVRRSSWRMLKPQETLEAIRRSVVNAFEISPSRIVLIHPFSLPKTSSGKIKRRATQQKLLEGTLKVIHSWESASENKLPDMEDILVQTINRRSIEYWLKHKIAEYAEMSPEEINSSASAKEYPLESVDAVHLTTDLSEWLNIDLNADVIWAFPTIDELIDFLLRKHKEE